MNIVGKKINLKYQHTVLNMFHVQDGKDVEILWRLVRAQYNLSKEKGTTEAEKKSLIYEAYALILEALEIDDNHYATHKWMSVLLDARSAYDGLKARITQLERVKLHMLVRLIDFLFLSYIQNVYLLLKLFLG